MYFCMLTVKTGTVGILEGAIICIVNNYNCFGDTSALFILVCFWILVCTAVDFFCVKICYPRIWKISNDSKDKIVDSLNLENIKKTGIFITKNDLIGSNGEMNKDRHKDSRSDESSKCQEIKNPSQTILSDREIENKVYEKMNARSKLLDECEIDELRQILKTNYHMRRFFETEIESIFKEDISVHEFILDFTSNKEDSMNKLKEIFRFNFKRFKIEQNSDEQFKKLSSINFKKAVEQKERDTKYQEIKSHFEKNEYKDPRFLQSFLKANTSWLRKSINHFFDDLMKGESHNELGRQYIQIQRCLLDIFNASLRELILERFHQIYGEYRISVIPQEIVKTNIAKKLNNMKSKVVVHDGGNVLLKIVKYWQQRCEVLRVASSLVGGYFLKSDQRVCHYCKSNWGLSIQTHESVEDLFVTFYKLKCRQLKIRFNFPMLFNNDLLVYNNEENYPDTTSCFDKGLEYEEEGNQELHIDEHIQELVSSQLKLPVNILKQKIFGSWQEFFHQHSNIFCICLECNDKAHESFIRNHVRLHNTNTKLESPNKPVQQTIDASELKTEANHLIEDEKDEEGSILSPAIGGAIVKKEELQSISFFGQMIKSPEMRKKDESPKSLRVIERFRPISSMDLKAHPVSSNELFNEDKKMDLELVNTYIEKNDKSPFKIHSVNEFPSKEISKIFREETDDNLTNFRAEDIPDQTNQQLFRDSHYLTNRQRLQIQFTDDNINSSRFLQ